MKVFVCYFHIKFYCVLQSQELLSGSLQAAGKKVQVLETACEHASDWAGSIWLLSEQLKYNQH